MALSEAFFGGASALDVAMDQVVCSGNENRLIECIYDPDNDCTHSEDAGVKCLAAATLPLPGKLTYEINIFHFTSGL